MCNAHNEALLRQREIARTTQFWSVVAHTKKIKKPTDLYELESDSRLRKRTIKIDPERQKIAVDRFKKHLDSKNGK